MKFKQGLSILLLLLLVFFTGCTSYNTDGNQYYSFIDSMQKKVNLPKKPCRIVALQGSLGEAVLLAGGELIGVTEDALSERDMQLENISIVGTVKQPNVEVILSLSPDFILLSNDIQSHTALDDVLSGIPHAYFKVDKFSEYIDMMSILCDITKRSDLFEKNVSLPKAQVELSIARASQLPKENILLLRAYSSGIKVKNSDNVAGEIFRDLGCNNIADSEKALLENISLEIILRYDPKYILVATMGSDSDAAIQSFKNMLSENPAWAALSAIKNGTIEILPKNLFHYKPNARWGESYEYAEKILFK